VTQRTPPQGSWEVAFYETAGGKRPAEKWHKSLPPKVQARFARAFELLEEYGISLTRPHVDHVRGKIWEVRVEHNNVQYRLLYFTAPGRRFVMLHGLTKARKIPLGDIEVAEQRARDYSTRWQQSHRKRE
jgi:phage-related protein